MPTTDVTNTLNAVITSTEQSTSNVPINRGTGNPAFASNVGQFVTYALLIAGVNVIPLAFNPATQVYVRNIDATRSIQVTWTQASQASALIVSLNPGDQIILWQNPSGAGSPPGITALSLTPSAAGALVEYFIGG